MVETFTRRWPFARGANAARLSLHHSLPSQIESVPMKEPGRWQSLVDAPRSIAENMTRTNKVLFGLAAVIWIVSIVALVFAVSRHAN